MAVNTNCGKWFKGNKQRRLKAKTCNSLGYCEFRIKSLRSQRKEGREEHNDALLPAKTDVLSYNFFVLVRGCVLIRDSRVLVECPPQTAPGRGLQLQKGTVNFL